MDVTLILCLDIRNMLIFLDLKDELLGVDIYTMEGLPEIFKS